MDPRFPILELFPVTAECSPQAHLTIGGCDVSELATTYGTPLYLFDEATLREQCRGFLQEFGSRYPDLAVLYASKAYINKSLAKLFAEEGLGLDIVSGGELAVAQAAGVPWNGSTSTATTRGRRSWPWRWTWVWDASSLTTFTRWRPWSPSASSSTRPRPSWCVSPPASTLTPTPTSPPAPPTANSASPWLQARPRRPSPAPRAAPHLDLVGIHMHLGSQLFETSPYTDAIEGVIAFAAQMVREQGLRLQEFSPGGGYAVQYLPEQPAPSLARYAETVTGALKQACEQNNLPLPRLILEPGRSMVGRAGVAVYTVGASKDIPGVRKYVAVDGGMADNIRPALYSAQYDAAVANRMADPSRGDGDHCREVLRVRRHPYPGVPWPGAPAWRPPSPPRLRGILSGHGQQLQPGAPSCGGHGQWGPGPPHPAQGDLPRPDAVGPVIRRPLSLASPALWNR